MSAAPAPGKVSVIIPTFNYGHFIADCIRSVLRQGIEDCEIIVVDDGSIDNTAAILEPYLDKICYIRQENQGLSAARNAGMKYAAGDFIQFLDSDDMLGKDALKGRLNFLAAHPENSIAVCRNALFTRTNRRGRPVRKGRWGLYQSNLALHLCRFNIAPPHAFLLRRRVVDVVGEFDTSLAACEDYDYWLRAVMSGFAPKFCPDGEVFYRVHSTSMSANRSSQVRHDAEMHLRLYRYLFIDDSYPNHDPLSFSLAFLTGLATTFSRLQASTEQSTALEPLREKFEKAAQHLEQALRSKPPKIQLSARLYAFWFTYQVLKNPELQRSIAQFDQISEFFSENLRASSVLRNLLHSIKELPSAGLVARRLAALSLASRFPGMATRFEDD